MSASTSHRASRCTKCGAVYSYPMSQADPHKCPGANERETTLHRVRTRTAGDARAVYRDVLASSPSDATRVVMERYAFVAEAAYVGPSPAGAKDGDSV